LDEKVWSGLVELLEDPQNLKAQVDKRLEARAYTPAISDNPESGMTGRELEKLDAQEKRLIDAYREGAINLPELKEQKSKIANKRNSLIADQKAVPSQISGSGQREITMTMLEDLSARFHHVTTKADFATRRKIVSLSVNSVTLYPKKAVVEGSIPIIQGDVLSPATLRSHLFWHRAWG
jgi:hypothetical protein